MNAELSTPWFNCLRSAARRLLFGWSLAAIFLATGLLPAAAKPSANSSNRFLFIVDTSSGMKRHRDEVLHSISEIIGNSASGQMHYGDTLGLWTFNDEVFAEFPLQMWATAERENIDQRITTFLKGQRLGKNSRFEKVLPNLLDIVANSDILTVFIFSNSGNLKMAGTPFDQEFNALYKTDLEESKRQHLPVVIVLQSKGGKLFRYTINPMPWPVVIPELPIPIKLPGVAENNIVATAPKPVALPVPIAVPPVTAITNAPLILSGNKANAQLAANTVTPTDAAMNPAPPPSFKPPKLPAAAVEPTPLAPSVPVAPVVLPVPPAFTPPTKAPTVAVPTVPAAPQASPFTRVSNAGNLRHPLPLAPANPAPTLATSSNIIYTNPVSAVEALNRLKARINEQTNVAPKIAPTTPIAAATPSITTKTNVAATTKSLQERALAFIAPPGQNRSQSLLIIAAILVLIALLLIVVIVRRSRATGPSLISRSLKK